MTLPDRASSATVHAYDAAVWRAVLFDFGGVITSSPFDAFASYEARVGLPDGFIRALNARDVHDNAWARLERNDFGVDEFIALFEAEARAAGGELDGAEVLACLRGELRPRVVSAVQTCALRFTTAILTNNFLTGSDEWSPTGTFAAVAEAVDVVVESSRVGCRKPEPRFYELALAEIGVAADEAVFLDDLGVNLRPARALGMATIKVVDPDAAMDELGALLGVDL
jgi:putative hydrolase of the HAD superfamily